LTQLITMEKIINKRVEEYSNSFIQKMKEKINSLNIYETDKINKFIDFIDNYNSLVFEKGDLIKPKRVKVEIDTTIRCTAKRINGEQCTRRKKQDCDYCGTHHKALPFGIFDGDTKSGDITLNVNIFTKEIQGIVYHIDKKLNIYNTEDILGERFNPQIIGKAFESNNVYTIQLY
jgi:hypothetical protein